jgi:1-deoxy-D-xylulose-5-phosphate synthase
MVVMAPADEDECRRMLTTAYRHAGPAAVRYPRGSGPGAAITRELDTLPIGKAEIRRSGKHIAILAFGSRVATALEVGEQLDATVVNMRFIKPLDTEMIVAIAAGHELIVTVEENALQGGAGAAINKVLLAHGISVPILNLGIPDRFIGQGTHAQQLAECGLDTTGIRTAIENRGSDIAVTAKLSASLPGTRSHG